MSQEVVTSRSDERSPLLPEATHHSNDEPNSITVQPLNSTKWTKSSLACYTLPVFLVTVIFLVLIQGPADTNGEDFDLGGALKKALGGGLSGAAAMVLQVLTLMPLRTVMNYQYRYGTTSKQAMRILYQDGGYSRFYSGLSAALIQGPVSRFGDTAANAGIIPLLQSNIWQKIPIILRILLQTFFASLASAAFRMILTPIDTLKTTLQTQGRDGVKLLKNRVRVYGIGSLWYGAFATAGGNFLGHYPWFATYNYLSNVLPQPHSLLQKLARQAFIGFMASVASDSISNCMRVLKTYRQVHETRISYTDSARAIIASDGIKGLFGRGLKTRILTNGLQGLMFSVLWKVFLDLWDEKTART